MWGREARGETLAEVRRVRVKCTAARNQESQSRTRTAQWLKTGGGRASISRVPNARNFDLSGVRAKELNVWVNILEKEGDVRRGKSGEERCHCGGTKTWASNL